jgi:hypothetical protein
VVALWEGWPAKKAELPARAGSPGTQPLGTLEPGILRAPGSNLSPSTQRACMSLDPTLSLDRVL